MWQPNRQGTYTDYSYVDILQVGQAGGRGVGQEQSSPEPCARPRRVLRPPPEDVNLYDSGTSWASTTRLLGSKETRTSLTTS